MKIFEEHRDRGPRVLPTLEWLDGPLNGGFRVGSAYLFGGAPGSNKSTLLAQVATALAHQRIPVLFVLTEQSRDDLAEIFERVNPDADAELAGLLREYIDLEPLDDVKGLPVLLRRRVPELYPHTKVIVVDSIQGSGLASTATRTYQRIFEFVDEARAHGITTCLISHVTKRGTIAGPKSLEHKVDVALVLRKALGTRQLFVPKNRYGAEVTEPLLLDVSERGLAPSRHAVEATSAALGYAGEGDELLEIQASVSLPRLGGRGELACPFLPAKRIKQILTTLSTLPGIDIGDLSCSINAYLPNLRGYAPVADLPLALAMLAAYLHLPLPAQTLFAGQLDLRRTIRSANPVYLSALAGLLTNGMAPGVRQVVLSAGAVGALEDAFPTDLPRPAVEVVGVRTLDELLTLLWPSVFATSDDCEDAA